MWRSPADPAVRKWTSTAAAYSQWQHGLDWEPGTRERQPRMRKTSCMGYAVRVPDHWGGTGATWTLVQWVSTPTHCEQHRCTGPLRGRETTGDWRLSAHGAESCARHADLFLAPAGFSINPSRVEPDAANVIRRYPHIAQRLRGMLARTMRLPNARVGLHRRGVDSYDSEAHERRRPVRIFRRDSGLRPSQL